MNCWKCQNNNIILVAGITANVLLRSMPYAFSLEDFNHRLFWKTTKSRARSFDSTLWPDPAQRKRARRQAYTAHWRPLRAHSCKWWIPSLLNSTIQSNPIDSTDHFSALLFRKWNFQEIVHVLLIWKKVEQTSLKMARNSEKAMTALARWRQLQLKEQGKLRVDRRPHLASEETNVRRAEKWRYQVVREIAKKVAQIQNGKVEPCFSRDFLQSSSSRSRGVQDSRSQRWNQQTFTREISLGRPSEGIRWGGFQENRAENDRQRRQRSSR